MKNFVLILISAIIIVGFLAIVITMWRKPYNSAISYLFNWKYRILKRIRSDYLWGVRKTPPDDYQYFYQGAINLIEKEHISHLDEAKDIIHMLQAPQYIHYYFVDQGAFSGEVYHQMYTDYRSGVYCTRDYDTVVALKKKLPIEISTNERAFNDFMKFVDAGWFDKTTGMFILGNGRNHQHIGRAIYWICYRNGIKNPGRVFSPLWEKMPETIRGWIHPSSNETITKGIDNIVFSILKD